MECARGGQLFDWISGVLSREVVEWECRHNIRGETQFDKRGRQVSCLIESAGFEKLQTDRTS